MEYRNPIELTPHHTSIEIYGDNHIDERFIEDIKEHGIRQPLIILNNNTIISGHRRWRVATLLKLSSVPVEIISPFIDDFEEKRAIIANNLQRDKDFSQKMREAEIWKEIESHDAKIRSNNNLVQYRDTPSSVSETRGETNDIVGQRVGIGKADTYRRAEKVWQSAKEGNPIAKKLIAKLDAGGESIRGAYDELKDYESGIQLKQTRYELAKAGKSIPQSDRWHVEVGDITTYKTEVKFDYIITDPPYPKEYLPLYEILAKRANEWLKPNGLLIAMCGQSYLDQIYGMLSSHLKYYWTTAYLTPGQPTPLRQRQVNSTWKPILIYSPTDNYKGKIFGDVYTSDKPEKDNHEWGQSVSGMLSIISQICLPGQIIFDPFLGSGTTGVAALKHGCLFHGIDIEEQNVNISKKRLAEVE
jgi:hypothetical protein